MDPQSPNKLIATKYCFLILGDDTSFFFFIFIYIFWLFYVIINLYKNYLIIIILFHLFIFLMKTIFIFSCSGMFQNVLSCGFIDALISWGNQWWYRVQMSAVFSGYTKKGVLQTRNLNWHILQASFGLFLLFFTNRK